MSNFSETARRLTAEGKPISADAVERFLKGEAQTSHRAADIYRVHLAVTRETMTDQFELLEGAFGRIVDRVPDKRGGNRHKGHRERV